MSKEDVINYVMTTPSNPNKAVLEGMLDSIIDAGGGGNSEEGTLIYEGDVAMSFSSAEIPISHNSICLNTNYRNGLYKFCFDDEVVYLLAYDIDSSSSMTGYSINTMQTSNDFTIQMNSPDNSRPVSLGNVFAKYYYYEGPAKTMHVKVYQLA